MTLRDDRDRVTREYQTTSCYNAMSFCIAFHKTGTKAFNLFSVPHTGPEIKHVIQTR